MRRRRAPEYGAGIAMNAAREINGNDGQAGVCDRFDGRPRSARELTLDPGANYGVGDQVAEGDELVAFTADGEAAGPDGETARVSMGSPDRED